MHVCMHIRVLHLYPHLCLCLCLCACEVRYHDEYHSIMPMGDVAALVPDEQVGQVRRCGCC